MLPTNLSQLGIRLGGSERRLQNPCPGDDGLHERIPVFRTTRHLVMRYGAADADDSKRTKG
jgi:hypothetical protein